MESDSNYPEVGLYDQLFKEAHPEAGGADFLHNLNANSLTVMQAMVESGLRAAKADDKFQFERHGCFAADQVDQAAGKLVFNLAEGLKDR